MNILLILLISLVAVLTSLLYLCGANIIIIFIECIVGILLMYLWIESIIANAKTNKLGEVCYGRVMNIQRTGFTINNTPELKAIIRVYIESIGNVEEFEEIIGLASKNTYKIGDYIKAKYYNGDINITLHIQASEVPLYIENMFKNQNVPEDYVSIDEVFKIENYM